MGVSVINIALLATYETDSAYWRERELLHLPAGSQLNLPWSRRVDRRPLSER